MITVNEIRPTKEAVEHDLLKRPGVTGCDIGHKYVGGKKTDELSIRVYVEKKKDKLTKDEAIPVVIEGIKTDVIERRYVLHPLKVPLQQLELLADAGKYDPLRGGISIGPCRAVNGSIYAGTLGVVVRDNATNAPMLLSNFHVMCVDNQWHTGDTMAQPSRVDGGNCPADVIGTLQRAVLNDKVDCAISSSYLRMNTCEIVDVGEVSGVAAAEVNMHVKKRGRTTALTYGTIDTIDLSVEIDYGDGLGRVRLTHQTGIMVDTSQSSKIGDHGDSGSALVNESNQVVGLYFAGSEDGTSGIANPIQDVLNTLDVSICTSIQPPSTQASIKAKDTLKPEFKEKDELKAEWKEQQKDKNEWKEHKDESKEHKNEWKEHHKVEIKEHKPEWKEAALEKNQFIEREPFLSQQATMGTAGGAIKTQLKPEFKERKETLKAEFKDELKAEWKEQQKDKNEWKEHKDESKEHKNEWKEHKDESKEHKNEWKEAALEKHQQFETGPGIPTQPFMSHFIPSTLRPDLSMGALGREPPGQETLSQRLKRQADEAKQAKDSKDTKEMKETEKLSEG